MSCDSVSGGSRTLLYVAMLSMLGALYAALIWAPTERIEGDIQRMMYLHVPAALTMYAGYLLLTVASAMYLLRRRSSWDEVAAAAGGVSTVFATVVMITGPMWAKPSWGIYWIWDGRLTSMFVLWLILIAYNMLRAYGSDEQQVARYGAVLALFGFADLPIIHYSVEWWRTLHPGPKLMTEGSIGLGMDTSMLLVLAVSLAATLMLFATLFVSRLELERLSRRVAAFHFHQTRPGIAG